MIDLAIVLALLCLGYGFGSYREKRHYKSIFEREEEFKNILLFEGRQLPAGQTLAGGHLVQGNVVISVDYFKMFVSGLRKLVGGRLRSYESLLDRGRREAVLRMKHDAHTKNAQQIFNVRFETSSISKGAQSNLGSIEVLVYGTAVSAK